MRSRREGGFTSAEICCVVGLSTLIVGLFAVVGLHAREAHNARAAQADTAALEDAVLCYLERRGLPPRDLNGDSVVSTEEVVTQLEDWNLLPQGFSPYDPWGREYVIVLNSEHLAFPPSRAEESDGSMKTTVGRAGVWSPGPDLAARPCMVKAPSLADSAVFVGLDLSGTSSSLDGGEAGRTGLK
ncbi:MAG: hypothetical protein ACYTAN_07930 [Planctomycetota bacterium]